MTAPEQSAVTVRQADREAAADLLRDHPGFVHDGDEIVTEEIRAGSRDASRTVQAFARHAAEARAEALKADEDRVNIACAAYAAVTGYYFPFHRGVSSVSADRMRDGMRAALSALLNTPQPEGSAA